MAVRCPRPTALIVGLALLTAGCTLGPSTRGPLVTSGPVITSRTAANVSAPPPTGPGGPGRTSAPAVWVPCVGVAGSDPATSANFSVDCSNISVPTSYTDPSRGTLSVEVARARAAGTPANAPDLVVTVGGPGQNGVDEIASVAGSLPPVITAHFAILVMDLRGTGDSHPSPCVSPANAEDLLALGADPTSADGAGVLSTLARDLTFDCSDAVGPLLTYLSTVPASDDLDTLRSALGTKQLNFLGRGYGATLGAVYADRYPARVGSFVLDSPSDPLQTAVQQATATASGAEAALSTFATACQSFPGGCPLGSDPRAQITSIVGKLGDTGVSGTQNLLISGGSLLLTVLLTLGDEAKWPDLAQAIAAVGNGDVDLLTDLLAAGIDRPISGEDLDTDSVAELLSAEVIYSCNDSAVRLSPDQLATQVALARKTAPLFGPFLLGIVGVCTDWPAPAQALSGVNGNGANPIIVVGSVDDPLSPYSGVESVSGQLASAVTVAWQSGEHGAYPASSCVTSVVDAYLLTSAVPTPGQICPP